MESCAKICLTILIINNFLMDKKVIQIILNIAKYIITLLLGYFGGNVLV